MRLTAFSVTGYANLRVELAGLGPLNFIYGVNASGKTTLLKAIDLFVKLLRRSVFEVATTVEYAVEVFTANFGPPPALVGKEARLEGEISGVGNIVIRIIRTPNVVVVVVEAPERFEVVFGGFRRALAGAEAARGTAEHAALAGRRALEQAQPNLDQAERVYAAVLAGTQEMWEPIRTNMTSLMVPPVALPVSSALRGRVVAAWQSKDIAERRRTRAALEQIGTILGWTAPIEPLTSDDVGLIREPAPVPLDDLGSGAQSLVGLLGQVSIEPARILLFSEPECHMNPVTHPDVVSFLEHLAAAGTQVFVETHSARFAPPSASIHLLQRDGDVSIARPITRADLSQFDNRVAVERPPLPSMLAHDYTVQIPGIVRERLGLKPGDFVYFSESAGSFRIVTREQADLDLGPVE